VTDPRWLDATEQRAWRNWIEATRRIQVAVEADLKARTALDTDDYEVMVRLSETAPDGMRMTDLADAVHNSPSRLSQRIDRMKRRGLVDRVRCADDGRVSYAVLTPQGWSALESAAPGHVDEVRRQFIDRLTREQVEALAEILPALADRD